MLEIFLSLIKTLQKVVSVSGLNIILTFVSALGAIGSVYFAFRTLQQNRISQIPVLQPTITDVDNPHLLKLQITNIGNGLAKHIRAKLSTSNEEMLFGSDLVPRKHQDFVVLTWEVDLIFESDNNPLFNNGELQITYEDVWNNKYSMKALFKPDVTADRRALGHIDKNFAGYFYY